MAERKAGGMGEERPPPDRVRGGLVAATVVVLVGALLVLARPAEYTSHLDRRLSTLRATGDGALALYLTLEELGVPVARRRTPLADAGPVDPVTGLLAPVRPLSPREVGALLGRVEEGGALLYAPSPGDGVLEALPLSLARRPGDAASVSGRIEAAGPLVSPEDTVRGADVFVRPASPDVPARALVALPGDSLSSVLELAWGEGRILVVADGSLLANERIRGAGAGPVVVRWAREVTSGRGPLTFDEFHQGAVETGVRESLGRFLGQHPAGRSLLHLAAVGLLALAAAGIRFGAPHATGRTSRRSPLEHVEALADTYREARARRIPRLLLLSGLARRLGRPRPRDEAEAATLLRRLEAGGRVDPHSVRRLRAALEGEEGPVAVAAAVDGILDRRRAP